VSLIFALAFLVPPAASATDAIAVVDSNVKCLLGGVRDGKWLASTETVSALKKEGRYRVVRADGTWTVAALSPPESAGGACEGTLAMEVKPEPAGGRPFIVIGGGWKPQPRPVTDIRAGKGRYTAAVKEFLESKGVHAAPEIRQLFRTDLDGDGTDEVIAVVQNFSESDNRAAGRYSAVLVRKVMNGRVRTLAATFEKDPREDGPSDHNVAIIADLNGDGLMEIVVHGRYKQGIFTTAYTVDGDKVAPVLSCACGG
jgi:hypothetical protein